MNRIKSFVIGLAEIGALMLFVISLVSLFSQVSHYVELLSHFRLQYLCFGILLFLMLATFKRYAGIFISACVFVINAVYVLPLYFSSSDHVSEPIHQDIKIILANVYTNNTEHKKLVDFVMEEQPDVLVLQEVDAIWINNLQALLANYPHKIIKAREDNFGIAILSKHEALSQQVVQWGELDIPSIESEYAVGDKFFHLLATHPLPPISEANYNFRNTQISALSYRASQIKTPKIVIGDLNMTMWSRDFSVLLDNTDLRNAREGFGVLPTWPTQMSMLMVPIDHILVSGTVGVKSIKTGPNIGSDHLPIVAVMRL